MCNAVAVGAPADSDTIPADLLWGADGRGEPSLYHFGVRGRPGDELSTDGAG